MSFIDYKESERELAKILKEMQEQFKITLEVQMGKDKKDVVVEQLSQPTYILIENVIDYLKKHHRLNINQYEIVDEMGFTVPIGDKVSSAILRNGEVYRVQPKKMCPNCVISFGSRKPRKVSKSRKVRKVRKVSKSRVKRT